MKIKFVLFYIFLFINTTLSAQWSKNNYDTRWNYSFVKIPSSVVSLDDRYFAIGEDHTETLQKFLNSYKEVVLPNITLNINFNGIRLKSNSKVYFQPNTNLKLIPTENGSYGLIKIYNVQNVQLFNARINGNRMRHLGNTGEWGMGIDVRSSKKIIIYNSNIINCWGDGIYLGMTNTGIVNNDISINKGFLDYNRRNGISVTSGENVSISDISIVNTYGKLPMAGIDIEPNKDSKKVNNIKLENVTTKNSGNEGILIYLSHLRYTNYKTSNITVINHKDYSSKIGFRVGPVSTNKAVGTIRISKSTWANNSSNPILFSDFSNSKLDIILKDNLMDSKKITKNSINITKHFLNEKTIKNVKFQ